ncbi:MAG: hypothetical protein ACRBN8_19990 [Nannocystales bacterium]
MRYATIGLSAVWTAVAVLGGCGADESTEPGIEATATSTSGGAETLTSTSSGQGTRASTGEAGPASTSGEETTVAETMGAETGEVVVGYSPCLAAGFDQGTDQSAAVGPGAFPQENSEVFSRTIHDHARAFDGTGSAQLGVAEGAQGFGQFGGILYVGQACAPTGRLEAGSEVWIRGRYFVPSDWEWLEPGHSNKFLRLRTFTAKGPSAGYDDLYVQPHPGDNLGFRFIYEGVQQWRDIPTPAPFAVDEWTTIEYYVAFDHVTAADGGQARVRVWRDGALLADIDDRATLTEGGYADDFLLFTYFGNDGAPKDQHLWVDDLVIATDQDPPTAVDAAGNAMVGAEIVAADF